MDDRKPGSEASQLNDLRSVRVGEVVLPSTKRWMALPSPCFLGLGQSRSSVLLPLPWRPSQGSTASKSFTPGATGDKRENGRRWASMRPGAPPSLWPPLLGHTGVVHIPAPSLNVWPLGKLLEWLKLFPHLWNGNDSNDHFRGQLWGFHGPMSVKPTSRGQDHSAFWEILSY